MCVSYVLNKHASYKHASVYWAVVVGLLNKLFRNVPASFRLEIQFYADIIVYFHRIKIYSVHFNNLN